MKTIYAILFSTLFASMQAQDFFIGSGAEVNMNSGALLYTAFDLQNEGTLSFDDTGDLYIDGGFNNIGGVLTLNDAIFHIGSGSASSGSNDVYFFNTGGDLAKFVEINKTGGTATTDASSGFLNITHTLTSDGSGTLDANEKITLKSTSVIETAIVPTSTGGVLNNLVVERFIPQKDAYRLLSSPITTTGSIWENWQESASTAPGLGMQITGYDDGSTPVGGNSSINGLDINRGFRYSMYTWGAGTQEWSPVTNTLASPLFNSEAYLAIVRGDRTIDISINDPNSDNVSTTLRSTGNLPIGNKTITDPATAANDFIAFGNPFQAPVSMQDIIDGTNSGNTTDSFSIWDPNIGQYGSYVTYTNGTGSNVPGSNQGINLQPGQAALVQAVATASTSVTFLESGKGNRSQLTEVFKGADKINSLDGFVRLGLYTPGTKPFVDMGKDGVIIRFDNQYSQNSERYNHGKLFGFDENLYILENNRALSVNSRSIPSQLDEIINIGLNFDEFENNVQYRFSVDLEGLNELPNGIILWDKYTDTYTDLEDKQIINFELDSSVPGSVTVDRFALVFQYSTLSVEDQNLSEMTVYPNPVSSNFIEIQFSQADNSDTTIEIFDLLGKRIMSREFDNVQNSLRLENLNFSTGIYLLNVKQDNQTRTFKIIKE